MPHHTTHFLLTTKIRSDLGFQYLTEVLKLFQPQSKVSTPTPTLLLKPRGPSTTHNSQVISLKHHKWHETQSQLNIQLSGTKENGTKQNCSFPRLFPTFSGQSAHQPGKFPSFVNLISEPRSAREEGSSGAGPSSVVLPKQGCWAEAQRSHRQLLGAHSWT